MIERLTALETFKCPRCLQKDMTQFRRGSLTNDSVFLPKHERQKTKAIKVPVRCTACGYRWRSRSQAVPFLLEEESHGENA